MYCKQYAYDLWTTPPLCPGVHVCVCSAVHMHTASNQKLDGEKVWEQGHNSVTWDLEWTMSEKALRFIVLSLCPGVCVCSAITQAWISRSWCWLLTDRTTDTCMRGLLPSNWMCTTQCFIGLEFKSNCIYSPEYIHQTCMHARTRTHTHIQTLPCFINPSSPLLEGRSTSNSFGDLESTVNFSVPVETQKMTSLLREGCNGLMLQSCKTAVSLVPRPPFNTEGGLGMRLDFCLLSALPIIQSAQLLQCHCSQSGGGSLIEECILCMCSSFWTRSGTFFASRMFETPGLGWTQYGTNVT